MSALVCTEMSEEVKLKRKEIIKKLDLLTVHDDDKSFQDIVTSVAFLTNTTAAYFSLLTDNCQIIKSAFGFVPSRISPNMSLFESFNVGLKESICCLTLKLSPEQPLIIPDTHLDPVLANNKFVVGPPYLRFYAGFPVRFNGINIGTLCAGDSTPRSELKPSVLSNLYLLRNKLSDLLIQREIKLQKRKKWFNLF